MLGSSQVKSSPPRHTIGGCLQIKDPTVSLRVLRMCSVPVGQSFLGRQLLWRRSPHLNLLIDACSNASSKTSCKLSCSRLRTIRLVWPRSLAYIAVARLAAGGTVSTCDPTQDALRIPVGLTFGQTVCSCLSHFLISIHVVLSIWAR